MAEGRALERSLTKSGVADQADAGIGAPETMVAGCEQRGSGGAGTGSGKITLDMHVRSFSWGFGFLGAVLAAGAPVRAQAPPQQPAVIQQFQKLEDGWSIAAVNKDQYALENLLSPTFLDISAAAQVTTRNQSIVNALGGVPEPLLSMEQKVVNVRTVGDVAIVEGTYVLRLKEDRKTRDERGVFTHVWQKGRLSWNCISAQRTAVVDQLEGARARTTTAAAASAPASAAVPEEKKSNAALPFHVPLLYKGADSKTKLPPQPPTPSDQLGAPVPDQGKPPASPQ